MNVGKREDGEFDDLCPHHRRVADERAALPPEPEPEETPEPEPNGDEPEPMSEAEQEPEPVAIGEPPQNGSPRRQVGRGELRQAIASDVEENYPGILGTLFMAAQAEKDVYVTCTHCGRRHTALVPDWNSRVNAIRLMIEAGYGRAKEEPASDANDPEQVLADLLARPRDDLDSRELELRLVLSAAQQDRELLNRLAGVVMDALRDAAA